MDVKKFVEKLIFDFITSDLRYGFSNLYERESEVDFSSFGSLDGLIENGVKVIKETIKEEQSLIDKAVDNNIYYKQYIEWIRLRENIKKYGNLNVGIYTCEKIIPNYSYIGGDGGCEVLDFFGQQVEEFINNKLDYGQLININEECIYSCDCCDGYIYGGGYVDKNNDYYVCKVCYKFDCCENRDKLVFTDFQEK